MFLALQHAYVKCDSRSGIIPDIPRLPIDTLMDDPNEDDDLIPPNERRPQRLLDSRRQNDGELSDSDDEGEGGRRDHASHRDSDLAHSTGRRAAVGIMSAGSTHGIGTSMATAVVGGSSTPAAGSSAQSDMEIDDETSLGSLVKKKKKTGRKSSTGSIMAVDPPATAS